MNVTYLVITLECTSELTDESSQDEFANLGQLCVDDSDNARENGCER